MVDDLKIVGHGLDVVRSSPALRKLYGMPRSLDEVLDEMIDEAEMMEFYDDYLAGW